MIGARILDRYVTREFLRLFILFVVCTPMLFVLSDLTDNIDTYMERKLTVPRVLFAYVYRFPQFMLWAFPIAALIATIFTVGNMTRHSEMAAAKAGGISFYRVLAPLPILGILLTLAGLVLTEIVPGAQRTWAHVIGDKKDHIGARTDFVFRSRQGGIYAIRFLDVERARIDGLTIHRQGDEVKNPTVIIVADEATYDEKKGWVLHNGYKRELMGPGREIAEPFTELVPGLYESPLDLLAEPKDPEEMRYQELGDFIDTMKRSGAEPRKLMVDQAQKIAIPFATLIIILFAAPLANTSPRGGAAYGIGISLGITVVYLMAFRLAAAAGASGTLEPNLAAWLPNLVLLAATVGIFTKVRT